MIGTLRVVLPVVLFTVGIAAGAQPFPIFNGTVNTCVGAFLDSGGQGGGGYGNNEDFTYTICPDNPGDAISVDFITANFATGGAAPIDNMTIYDGDNVGAPLIGNWTGGALQSQVISASIGNVTGCLTFVWHSNNSGLGIFAGSITCTTPCARPTAVATISGGAPAMVCIGEAVTFNGSGSFAAPGFSLAQYTWDFDDGSTSSAWPVASHAFATPGEYIVQLYLEDNNGCASTNRVDLQVLVGTEPTFTGTGGDQSGCLGETLCLDGTVNPVTWSAIPDVNYGNGILLPDDVGSCFTSELLFTQFPPGATLNNIADLNTICFDIEHSFLGDLVISIISPSGETVILHQQGGGGTYLGIPDDNDEANPNPGTCWTYCFDVNATNGTMAANAGTTLPAGTYESVQPLNGLLGSALNGIWTLEICDLWGLDNGFLCGFTIDFDPALFNSLTVFTPVYGNACDSTWWTGPNITSSSGDCDQICVTPSAVGTFNYVYHAVDNFGCTYDTTIAVTIVPGPQVDAGADVVICASGPVQLNALVSGLIPPEPCVYTLDLFDTFGDGWDGATVTVTVGGVATVYGMGTGTDISYNIPVVDGQSIQISYQPSLLFNNEHSYVLSDANGIAVFTDNPPFPNGVTFNGVADCAPGTGAVVYSWAPATGLSNPNIANPVATVGSTTTYTVTIYQDGYAGCPSTSDITITVGAVVDAGINGSIALCSNAAPIGLFGLLGGTPDVGGTWTGPGGAFSGTLDPGIDPAGIYTYTVLGVVPCPDAFATVAVTINTPPDAGTDGSITLCSTDAATSLFAQLGGSPDAGGVWSGPSPVVGGMLDPATMLAGVYTYTVAGAAPCPNDVATVTVTISTPPDAGTDGAITVCYTDPATSLFAQLGGSPDAGGVWSGPSPVVGGMLDPAAMLAGAYTYTVAGVAPCPTDDAIVTVTINTPPDAGTDGSITLCSTDAATSLFAQLGGTPDVGGTWTGPGGAFSGTLDPGIDPAGIYTYTVLGVVPCPDAFATVAVTINTPPDAGTDGTITLCSTDAATSLFAQLGGSPDTGGVWSGPSPVVGGMLDPATMLAGAYTYTVAGVAPCPNDVATVTVTISTPPDAGTDGAITVCYTDPATSLFAQLGGSPDAGGVWSGPSPVVGGMLDPAAMLAGAYTYTVAGVAPCPTDDAIVTVTINTPPDAGTDGSITLCSTDAATSLFAQLGGTPDVGGTWTGPGGAFSGTLDPGIDPAGIYTYTVLGVVPCPDAFATVAVTINTPPDAGTDGTITLCSTDAATSLFAQLGGSPDTGGVWSGPSPVVGGMLDPATMLAGAYTYTVAGVAPCPNDAGIVTVTINTPPDAGTDGSITLCSTDAATSLFAQLGGSPDAGGVWSGPSPVIGGMINPSTMNAGVYTYTVAGVAPCPNDVAIVTVTINTPPDAGTDGTITLCSTDPAASLFAQLGGSPDAGGVWSGPSPVIGGMINPSTMNAGVYTYTVAGVAPCPNDVAIVTVTINTPPDAGTDGTITLCSTDPAASLFAQLGGSPDAGGVWSGPSPVVGDMINPGTMNAGVYTYTVAGVAPCPDEVAMVTVVVNAMPDAGIDGAIALCATSPATSLFAQLGGTPDVGGTWSGPSPVVGAMFDPGNMAPGLYTYTVTGALPCPNVSATVNVNVVINPDAGTPGSITLCASATPLPLFNQLGGTPDPGGAWSGPSPVIGGMFDPGTMAAGVYTYTIIVPPPCVNASSTVTVNVVQPPDPGSDGALTLCISSPATALFASLGGSPDVGGMWSGPSPVIGGLFNPGNMTAGVYTYTVVGSAPCPSDDAIVTVAVVSAPDAGTPGSANLCATDAPIGLYTELGGTPDPGGAWSGPSPVVGGLFDPANMSAGIYTYTIVVPPPCVNASSTVTVNVVQPPDPGSDGVLTLCISSPATALFASLGGSPDVGGAWSGPSPVVGGLFNPGNMTAGVYTYTVAGTAPCPADDATVTVTVVAAPDAGTPGTATLCATDAPIDLYTDLGGTPDPGGAWSGPSPVIAGMFDPGNMTAGVYTYTIVVPPPCVNASSTVTINVVQPPDAGSDGALTLCISSPATALFTSLGGSPDVGGAWSGPSPVVGGLFNPANMSAGVYTYTVAGTAPCPADDATVTVTVVAAPDAGTPGNATLCATDAPIDLYTELGGTPDPGGAWSGPSPVIGGLFDPGNMIAGVYTYTIVVPPPCVDVSSPVTIGVVAPPDAGVDASLLLCISSPATDLFAALGGTPDVGGAWTDPNGVSHSGLFDPANDPPGAYTYTVVGTIPCPNAMSNATVTVATLPDPGLPGVIALCASDAAVSLFAQLGGTPDPGGTWTDPNGLAFGGSFDPALHPIGVYTYTIAVPPPCTSVSATVDVSVVQPPDPGTNGTLIACVTGSPQDLFTLLGGAPNAGGSWTDPSNNAHSGIFDPAVDAPGNYVYTVSGTTPCPDLSSMVSVSVVVAPDAGLDGILNLCQTGNGAQLFGSIGGTPDLGGTWTDPNGNAFGGFFAPGVDMSGNYTYTVSGTVPCPSDDAVVTVNVLTDADAGGDGSLLLCADATPFDMFSVLQGTPDPGGIWLDPFGQACSGTLDPALAPQGTYTYVLTVPLPCINDTALVNVTIVQPPNAGSNGALTLCSNDAPVQLFNLLGGNPDANGAWTDPNGLAFSGAFDPATDPQGAYTYLVAATAPCADALATVTITVEQLPDAGIDGSTIVCPEAAMVNLFALLGGTPDGGGSWTDPNGNASNGLFDPAVDPQGNYTYTVYGLTACPNASASAVVSIYVVAPPDACPDAITCDLQYTLSATGNWTTGTWSGPGTASIDDPYGASTGVTSAQGGSALFVFTIVSPDGCAAADSVVITFTEAIVPMTMTTDAVCNAACDGTASVSVVGGNVGTTGYTYQWSNGVAGPADTVATGLCAGSYTVIVLDTNACSAQADFTINEPPPLVIDAVLAIDETCPGSCDGTLTVNDPQGEQYSFDGGITFGSSPVANGLCAGTYAIVMLDANSCVASSTAEVLSPDPVIADFYAAPDSVLVSDPFVQFVNTSSNATAFAWDFAGLGSSTDIDPTFTFPGVLGATYTVCLIASNSNGCTDTVCAPVVVLDLLVVHVPNTFTPNGDGTNDGFMPIFNEPSIVQEYEFLIFDRWGERIWESSTVHEAWTGAYQGEVVETEVYVWKLNYKDARSHETGSVIGHVTMLR